MKTKVICHNFNGFKVSPEDELLKIIPPSSKDHKLTDIIMGWSRCIFQFGSEFVVSGFFNGKPGTTHKIDHKSETFCGGSANEKYALFYNSREIWRYSLNFVLGEEDPWKRIVGVNAEDGNSFIKVACGERIYLALTSDGKLFNLPLEVGTQQIEGKIIDICCGFEHCIALTDTGNVYTWGNGSRCQLGHGEIEAEEQPRLVDALAGVKIVKIAAGGWHCSVISEFGDLYCWGWNDCGQLGIKTELSKLPLQNYAIPMLVDFYNAEGENVELNANNVACGAKHTVVILEDDSVWRSGNNKYKLLGQDTEEKILFFKHFEQYKNMKIIKLICGSWGFAILYD